MIESLLQNIQEESWIEIALSLAIMFSIVLLIFVVGVGVLFFVGAWIEWRTQHEERRREKAHMNSCVQFPHYNTRKNPHIFRDTLKRIMRTEPLEYRKLVA